MNEEVTIKYKYHITWLSSKEDFYSVGKVYEAENPIVALTEFKNDNPNAIFLSLVSEDLIQIRVG